MGRNNTKAVKNIAKMYEQLRLTQDDIFHTSQKNDAAIEFSSGFYDSDFKMKIGGTVYEISTHFDPKGSRCVLQQFRDLILSEDLLENRIIAESAEAR